MEELLNFLTNYKRWGIFCENEVEALEVCRMLNSEIVSYVLRSNCTYSGTFTASYYGVDNWCNGPCDTIGFDGDMDSKKFYSKNNVVIKNASNFIYKKPPIKVCEFLVRAGDNDA